MTDMGDEMVSATPKERLDVVRAILEHDARPDDDPRQTVTIIEVLHQVTDLSREYYIGANLRRAFEGTAPEDVIT